jgi:hypothetical protein
MHTNENHSKQNLQNNQTMKENYSLSALRAHAGKWLIRPFLYLCLLGGAPRNAVAEEAAAINPQELLNKQVHVNFTQVTLREALNQIERSAKVKFAYSKDVIQVNQTISLDIRSGTLSVVLDKLLSPLAISFMATSDQILLFASPKQNALPLTPALLSTPPPSEHRVRGSVVDAETKEPLPGVNIQIKSAQAGTITDNEGTYTLSVPTGNETLIFSYVGYTKQEIAIAQRDVIHVSLSADVRNLETVVVTALGIKRESKKLGYATATVNTEAISTNRTNNLGNNLQGKIAGVNVTASASGTAGTSKIRIRGQSSFKGDNSPLIIVNGIPVNNSSFGAKSGDAEGTTTLEELPPTVGMGS